MEDHRINDHAFLQVFRSLCYSLCGSFATMPTSLEVQKAYLRLWAADINAEIDERLSPKAQFTKFAIHVLGWRGGDGNWNRRWEECFGEEYPWVSSRESQWTRYNAAMLKSTGAHIIIRMMAPSVSSNISSNISTPTNISTPSIISTPSESSQWTEMEGEDFIAKFEQLSLQRGWSRKDAKKYRTQAIDDDIISTYGVDLTKLEEWQKLCSDVGMDPVPRTITQCKKVSFRSQLS
jgi:hypothetical protein